MSLAVGFSRVTGLVREMVFAGLFGAGMRYDAFVAAYRIPNLLRDLLAEGALSAAFVTTYSQTLSAKGRDEAYALSNRLTTLLVPVLIAICVLGAVFAPALVAWIFPGYVEIEGKFELTVLLTRVMMPFLLLIALAAKAMGVLNSHGKFGISALSSGFFNITSVVPDSCSGSLSGPSWASSRSSAWPSAPCWVAACNTSARFPASDARGSGSVRWRGSLAPVFAKYCA